MSNRPGIGQIVHYTSYGTPGGEYASECRAAIVTQVYTAPRSDSEGRVIEQHEYAGLAVLTPTGLFLNNAVSRDVEAEAPVDQATANAAPNYRGGTWHMPCVRS